MAKVRFLTSVAGERWSAANGDVIEMDDDEALKWADGERAELVEDAPAPTPARIRDRVRGVEHAVTN